MKIIKDNNQTYFKAECDHCLSILKVRPSDRDSLGWLICPCCNRKIDPTLQKLDEEETNMKEQKYTDDYIRSVLETMTEEQKQAVKTALEQKTEKGELEEEDPNWKDNLPRGYNYDDYSDHVLVVREKLIRLYKKLDEEEIKMKEQKYTNDYILSVIETMTEEQKQAVIYAVKTALEQETWKGELEEEDPNWKDNLPRGYNYDDYSDAEEDRIELVKD